MKIRIKKLSWTMMMGSDQGGVSTKNHEISTKSARKITKSRLARFFSKKNRAIFVIRARKSRKLHEITIVISWFPTLKYTVNFWSLIFKNGEFQTLFPKKVKYPRKNFFLCFRHSSSNLTYLCLKIRSRFTRGRSGELTQVWNWKTGGMEKFCVGWRYFQKFLHQ